MKFSRTLSVIFILAMLLLSSTAIATTATSATTQNAPKGSHSPTFSGSAGKVMLRGPIKAYPAFVTHALAPPKTTAKYPSINAKPGVTSEKSVSPAQCTPYVNCLIVPPPISCTTLGTGCDSYGALSAPSIPGLNAVDSGGSYGTDIEPPDQGLCAGPGYVVEVTNLGVLRVWTSSLTGGSADITLDSLMGLTSLTPTYGPGTGWSSGGDVQCLYDYDNGGHWFITEFVSTTSMSYGGAFAGCFKGVLDTCLEGLAVSVSSNPLGAYNVYFLNPNWCACEPGNGYLLNDYTKIGNTRDALLVFWDEFNLNGATIPSCPAYGCAGFNGAQEWAINKKALELGWPVFTPWAGGNPNLYFNVAVMNMGLLSSPEPFPFDSCGQDAPAYYYTSCWYQVIPAMSPDPTQFDNNYGGTGYMFATMDFFGAGDNRIAVFYWTGLSGLNSYFCGACGSIGFSTPQILGGDPTLATTASTVNAYRDEGVGCYPTYLASYCGLGVQKAGGIPLGDTNRSGYGGGPEFGIATNGDGATQASYAGRQIWGSVSTLVQQTYGVTCSTACPTVHIGAAFFAVGTAAFDSGGPLSVTAQGYATAKYEDMEFPVVAASDGGISVMSFTLSGNDYFPSSAWGKLTTTSHGLMSSVFHISQLGKAPEDGFCEYVCGDRPRWGDYGAAVYVPSTPGSTSGNTYFASEYIQAPACSDAYYFLTDPSCGMTRDPFANWGTSVNFATGI